VNWCCHLEQSLKESEGNQVIISLSGVTLVNCLVEFASGFLDFWINIINFGRKCGGCMGILSLVDGWSIFCCAILQ
jgi:hypothetical protein